MKVNLPLKTRLLGSTRSARTLLLRLLAAIALVASATALAPAPAPAAADDGSDLTVVWPEVTRFNPDHTAYTFEVHDTGPGELYAVWDDNGYRVDEPVEHDGPHTMTFASDGSGRIEIKRCLEDLGCGVEARSPELDVRHEQQVQFGDGGPWLVGAQRASTFDVLVVGASGVPVELAWRLDRTYSDETVATGAPTTLVPDAAGHVQLPIRVEASLPSGNYDLYVSADTDLEPFGHLSGVSLSRVVVVDNTVAAPYVGKVPATFYPYRDGYEDAMSVAFRTAEYGAVTVDVLDRDGDRVKRILDVDGTSGERVRWNGTNRSGDVVAPGRYTLDFRFRDTAGNTSATTRTVGVSGKRVVSKVWTRTFPASSTVVDQTVGRCSSLSTPARPGWKKSLGYHSLTKCHGASQGLVATTNGVYVPASVTDHYGDLRVSLKGTGASGSAGRPYLVLGYLRAGNERFSARSVFRAGTNHPGKNVAAGPYVRERTTRPYVLWLTGLTDGSRYDVRSFTLRLGYDVLR